MTTTGRIVAFVAGIAFAAAPSLLAIHALRSQPAPAGGTAVAASQPVGGDFIRTYLMENPEVIRDAFYELERRKAEAEQKERVATITENKSVLFDSTRQAVLGNPQGDVTLVEFFDYNCGYCKRALGDMDRLIEGDSNLRVVLKEFPVLGQGSVEAAQVAAAVNIMAPDQYGTFHEKLLMAKGRANGAKAIEVTKELGLDQDELAKTLKNPEVAATIDETYALAKTLGLTGTPSYVIGDEVVFGAVGYDELKAKIDDMRACGSTSC
ncbi:DsbA family protein [Breoghania sp. JC706]|uniref:DsbA family protein n=1 Tax=Breoghania sp. JC706 TaxID=3117732 RepID=UPI003008FFA3